MLHTLRGAALFACALGVAATAQAPQSSDQAETAPTTLRLRFASFDPLTAQPEIPVALRSTERQSLWIVQFAGTPTQAGRSIVAELGGKIVGYLPEDAYVVRMPAGAVADVQDVAAVRWVGAYHPAFRLEPELLATQAYARPEAVRYHLVVADKQTDKPALVANITAIGGRVDDEHTGSLLLDATLTGPQLLQAAGLDEVLWIDRWSPPELDMDNARIQGGGNYVESQVGYTGSGVNAHIYEGIEASHPDFTGGATAVRSGASAQTHGHATGGIVFGNGSSNPAVRGMAPDAGKFYTNYTSVSGSRWQVFSDLVNIHNVSHTTASWGDARTFFYTSISAESDDIVFDHDLAWTQSQSNAGNQDSRPQAWAKNVFSIGGVNHANDSNPNNDSWQNGGASTGPAADGRIKPTLCAYYDNIGTSDLQGSAGYSSANWTAGFGGTSGATPIVAGHNVLAIEMFTDDSATPGFGRFGNALRVPGGTVHQNRPHFPTLKALQVVSAAQYAFTSSSSDNRREHQGWGFPDLRQMWDNRGKTFLVDETDVLAQGEASRWDVTVAPGEPALKICMTYSEPAANPAAAKTLINDLSLRVTAPNGTVYWGNNGLEGGVWSVAGGVEDDTNPLECVFVQNPQAGVWRVDVKATAVVFDSHVETPAVDADYGLAVSGGTGQPGIPPVFASFETFGQGCPGSVPQASFCAELNPAGGTLSNSTNQYEYTFTVPSIGSAQVTSFEIYTSSNSGTIQRPAHIYAQVGSGPSTTPLATTTITVGTTPGFYTATFASPVAVNGTFYVGYENSPSGLVSNLNAGAGGSGYYRNAGTGNWQLSQLVQRPSYRVTCTGGSSFATPSLGNVGLPTLNGSYSVTLADAVTSSLAVLVSGVSDTVFQGAPLPQALPGAPGCDLLVSAELLLASPTGATGSASQNITVPNNASLVGADVFHQWVVFDAVNTLGLIVSPAGRATIGN